MKKTVRFLSIVLVFIMVATMLTSCGSKYPALQKAFKDKGYEENAKFTAIAEAVKAELEQEEYAVELHMLTKTDGLASGLGDVYKRQPLCLSLNSSPQRN